MEKKKKKTKYQPLDISMTVVKSTWAEDDDKDALAISDLSALREKLPTAPKAVRNAYDISQLSSNGPWKAKLNNLPFNAREEEIIKFLGGDSEVKNIDIPFNGNRMRGYAIAEFVSREALANALTKTDDSIMGRRIPINLCTGDDGYGDYGDSRSAWSRRDDNRKPPRDDDDGDWRSTAIQNRDETIGRQDRSSPANGGDWTRNNRRPWQDDESRTNRRFDSSRNNFDRYEGDRDGPRRDWNRDSDRSDFRSDRRERPNYERDSREGWDRRDGAGPLERSDRTAESRDRRDARSYDKPTEQRERPRLNLQPRSKPVEPVTTNGTDSNRSSIFGAAKPVDTASKEREIENRLEKEGRLVTGDFQRRRQAGSETAFPEKEEVSQSGGPKSYRSRKSSDSSSQGKVRGSLSSARSDTEATSPPIRSGSESESFSDNTRRCPKEGGNVNDDDFSVDRNRRSSEASGEPPVQVIDAPPPSFNIWNVRKSQMQKRNEEASATPVRNEPEPSRCTTVSDTVTTALPSVSASNKNNSSQIVTPRDDTTPESSVTAINNQSSNEEHKIAGTGDSVTMENKDTDKEERVANTPSQSHQVRRPPVVVSVSAAQRAAAEGQPPPPPIHENAWHNSQAAMDSVRRPPSPSRHGTGSHQSYSSDRSYSYQSQHSHAGHNDWQEGGQRMQRMDGGYRDNSGYRENSGYRGGSGYRSGNNRGWRSGRGGGRGSYRGRGRGGYRYGGNDPNSADM